MRLHPCCRGVVNKPGESVATEVITPKRGLHKMFARLGSALKWITPTAVLVLIPKCPMCVAAYIALGTGVSIAMPLATWIREGLIVACVGVLAVVTLSTARRRLMVVRSRSV